LLTTPSPPTAKIRVLSVVDVYTRECLALEAGHRFCQPAGDARVLDEVIAVRGLPQGDSL